MSAGQANSENSNSELVTWPAIFIQFFQGLPGLFRGELESVQQHINAQVTHFMSAPAPQMWKAIGDEMVFWQEVEDEYQVAAGILAWSQALQRVRETLRKEGLDVKGAAWLGTFPFPNREVAIPRSLLTARQPDQPISANESNLRLNDYVVDFIGPQIDGGFRVASKSTPRRMCLSIEAAQVLASTDKGHLPQHRMFYEGTFELKGVHASRPYPIFWVDCDPEDEFSNTEDELLGRQPADYSKVRDLARCALELAGQCTVHLNNARNVQFRAAFELSEKVTALIEEHQTEYPEVILDDAPTVDPLTAESEPNLSDKISEFRRH